MSFEPLGEFIYSFFLILTRVYYNIGWTTNADPKTAHKSERLVGGLSSHLQQRQGVFMTPWSVSTPSQTRRRLQKPPMSHNDLWAVFHPIPTRNGPTDPTFATNTSGWGRFLPTTWHCTQIGPKARDDRAGRMVIQRLETRHVSSLWYVFFSLKLFIKFTYIFFSYILHDGAWKYVQTTCVWAELYSRTQLPQTKLAQIKFKRRFANVHRCLDLGLH